MSMNKKMLQCLVVFAALSGFSAGFAQSASGIQCPGCLVNYATAQNLADAIGDIVGVDPAAVVVVAGDAPGTFRVTLPDGRYFSVAPVGPVFRHQNAVQRRLSPTDDGGLHLRSQTRIELQLRSAIHREDQLIAEMVRLGWTNFYWFRNGMEVEAPNGTRYCFEPDMSVYPQTAPAAISVTLDAQGNLVVVHADGIRQRLHACAHDLLQLRDQLRTQLRLQLAIDTNGTITVPVGGVATRYRLGTQLRWSNRLDQPALFNEGVRLFLRYRDGWEQEIIAVN